MFKTIVVGCDGSTRSVAAIELASRLRDPDGRLVLASIYPHVMALPSLAPHAGNDRMREEAQEILALSAKRVPEGVDHQTVAEPNQSIAGGLTAAAEREDADLIVLGPSHRRSLGRMTGRMTAQRLLHGAPCAVAVAADHPVAGSLVVGYDGSEESRVALATAYALAAQMRLPVVELRAVVEPVTYLGPYVAAIDPELEQQMAERVQRELALRAAEAPDGVSVTTRIVWGAADDELLEAASDGAGMIIAGSRGYGTLHRAVAGSVSGALLTQSRVPVLITPRGAAVALQAA